MLNFKVFHHNDNDGRAAAAVINEFVMTQIQDRETDCTIKFIEVDYNTSIPTEELLNENDIVYVVDYSFTNQTINDLIDITKKAEAVYWFDHHKTSLEVYDFVKEKELCEECIIDMDRSGAMITLDYFKHEIEPFREYRMRKVVELVDDYDRWIHNDPDSMLFNIGSEMYDTSPESDIWFSSPVEVIKKGETIREYENKKNSRLVKQHAFIIKINGHDCIVLNTPESSSKVFAKYFDRYQFAIRYVYNGTNYSYSVYSGLEDIDCSKIAKYFDPSGGGHKGAAGFRSDNNLFSDGQVFVI